jgi:hypothetical protein
MPLAVLAAGAVLPIVELLHNGSGDQLWAKATATLWMLAFCIDTNRVAVIAVGALPPAMQLLRGRSDQGSENATSALANFAIVDDIAVTTVAARVLLLPVELPSGGSDDGRAEAAEALEILALDNNNNT